MRQPGEHPTVSSCGHGFTGCQHIIGRRGRAPRLALARHFWRVFQANRPSGRLPHIGSTEAISQQCQAVIETGDLAGFVLTFPDFIADRRCFGERVLPLLAAARLAQPLCQVV